MAFNPEEVLAWDINKLWNEFSIIKETTGQYNQEYEQVKNGIKLKFPIYYITNEWYEIYPSHHRAKVLGYGKMEITEFMTEIEQRQTIMRNIIIEENTNDEIIEPR